jgi:hypothetical protein
MASSINNNALIKNIQALHGQLNLYTEYLEAMESALASDEHHSVIRNALDDAGFNHIQLSRNLIKDVSLEDIICFGVRANFDLRTISGIYSCDSQNMFIALYHCENPEKAIIIAKHEYWGHHLVREKFGDQLEVLCLEAFNRISEGSVNYINDYYKFSLEQDNERFALVQEVIASLAEDFIGTQNEFLKFVEKLLTDTSSRIELIV